MTQREPPQYWDKPPVGFRKFQVKKRKKKVDLKLRQARLRYAIARKKKRRQKAAKKSIPLAMSEQASKMGTKGGRMTLKKHGREYFSEIGKMHGVEWKKKQKEML